MMLKNTGYLKQMKLRCEVHLVRISPEEIKQYTSKCSSGRKRKHSDNGKWENETFGKRDWTNENAKKMRQDRQARSCVKSNYRDRFKKLRKARERKKSSLDVSANSDSTLNTSTEHNDSSIESDKDSSNDDSNDEFSDSIFCRENSSSTSKFDNTVHISTADSIGVRKNKNQVCPINFIKTSEVNSSHSQSKCKETSSSLEHVNVGRNDCETLQREKADMINNTHDISSINSHRKVYDESKSACIDTNAKIPPVRNMLGSIGKVNNTMPVRKVEDTAVKSTVNTRKLESKGNINKRNFVICKESNSRTLKGNHNSYNRNAKYHEKIQSSIVRERNNRYTVDKASFQNMKCERFEAKKKQNTKLLKYDNNADSLLSDIKESQKTVCQTAAAGDNGDINRKRNSNIKRRFSYDSSEKSKRSKAAENKSKTSKVTARSRSASLGSHKNYIDRLEVNGKSDEDNSELHDSVNYSNDENLSITKETNVLYGTGSVAIQSNNKFPLKGILKNKSEYILNSSSTKQVSEKCQATKSPPSGTLMYYKDYLKSLDEETSEKASASNENKKIYDTKSKCKKGKENSVSNLRNNTAVKIYETNSEYCAIESPLECEEKSLFKVDSEHMNISLLAAVEENSTKSENSSSNLPCSEKGTKESPVSEHNGKNENIELDTKCEGLEQKKYVNKKVDSETCKNKKNKGRERKDFDKILTKRIEDKCISLFGSSLRDIPSTSSGSNENITDTVDINKLFLSSASNTVSNAVTQHLPNNVSDNKMLHCTSNDTEAVVNHLETVFEPVDIDTEMTDDIQKSTSIYENSGGDELNSSQESAIATENLLKELEGDLLNTSLCENGSPQRKKNHQMSVNSDNRHSTADGEITMDDGFKKITQQINRIPNDLSVESVCTGDKGSELSETNCGNRKQVSIRHTRSDSSEQPNIPEISLPETVNLSENDIELLNCLDNVANENNILPEEIASSASSGNSTEQQSARRNSKENVPVSEIMVLLDKKIDECNKRNNALDRQRNYLEDSSYIVGSGKLLNETQKDKTSDLGITDKVLQLQDKFSSSSVNSNNEQNCPQSKNGTSNGNETGPSIDTTTEIVENFNNSSPLLKRETVDDSYPAINSSCGNISDISFGQEQDLSETIKSPKSLLQTTPSETTKCHAEVKAECNEIDSDPPSSQNSNYSKSTTQYQASYNTDVSVNNTGVDICNIKYSPRPYLTEQDQDAPDTLSFAPVLSDSLISNINCFDDQGSLVPVPSSLDSVITNTNTSNAQESHSMIGKIRVRPPESLGLSINSNLNINNAALPESSRALCDISPEILETLLVSFLDLDTYWERLAKAKTMTCIREKEMDLALRTLIDSWELRSRIMLQSLDCHTYNDNFYSTVLEYVRINNQKPYEGKTLNEVKVLIKSVLSIFNVSTNLQDAELIQKEKQLLQRKEHVMKSLVDIEIYGFLDLYLKKNFATPLESGSKNSNEKYEHISLPDNNTTLFSNDSLVKDNAIPPQNNHVITETNSNDDHRNECENSIAVSDLISSDYAHAQRYKISDTTQNGNLYASQTITPNLCKDINSQNKQQNSDIQQPSTSQNICHQLARQNSQTQNILYNLPITSALLQRDNLNFQRRTSDSCEVRTAQNLPVPNRYERSISEPQASHHQTSTATNLQHRVSNQYLSSTTSNFWKQVSNQNQIAQNMQQSISHQYNNIERHNLDQHSQSVNTATQSANTSMHHAVSFPTQNPLNSCTLPASNVLNSISTTQHVNSIHGINNRDLNIDRTQLNRFTSANNSYTIPQTTPNVAYACAQTRRDQVGNNISILSRSMSSYQGNNLQIPASQQLATLRQQSSTTSVPNSVSKNGNQNLLATSRINQNIMTLSRTANFCGSSQANRTAPDQIQAVNNLVESCFRTTLDYQTANSTNSFNQRIGSYRRTSSDQRIGNRRNSSDQRMDNPGISLEQRVSDYQRASMHQQTVNNFRTDFSQTDLFSNMLNPTSSNRTSTTNPLSGFIPYTMNNVVSPPEQSTTINSNYNIPVTCVASAVSSRFNFSSNSSKQTVPYRREIVPNSLPNTNNINFSNTDFPQEATYGIRRQCSLDNPGFVQNVNVSLSVQSTYVPTTESSFHSWRQRNSEENIVQTNRTFPPNHANLPIQPVWPTSTGMPECDRIEQPVAADAAFYGVRSVSRDSGYTTPSPVVPLPTVREQEDMGPVDVGTFCNACFKPAGFTCFNCSQVNYCSKECQENDWTYHQPICSKTLSTENDLQL